jgi:ComEC/Rec2-related protein
MFKYPALSFSFLLISGLVFFQDINPLWIYISVFFSIVSFRYGMFNDYFLAVSIFLFGGYLHGETLEMKIEAARWQNQNSIVCLQSLEKNQNGELKFIAEAIQGDFKPGTNILITFHDFSNCEVPKEGFIYALNGDFYFPSPPVFQEAFDYRDYLSRKGIDILFKAKASNCKKIGETEPSLLTQLRIKIREVWQNMELSTEQAAVISALTSGDKSGLNNDVRSTFTRAGLAHILAVSGLHAGLIFGLCVRFFSFIPRNIRYGNLLRFFLPIIFLWSYAVLTGFGPSVLRASAMMTLVQTATVFKRVGSGLNLLGVVSFILILIKPQLIYDLGFQYSLLAVYGILVFNLIYPIPHKQAKWKTYLIQSIGVSLFAQLFTTPISLFHFGQFPVWFLLSNLLALPFVTFLLYFSSFSLLWGLIGFPVTIIGKLNGQLCDFLLFIGNAYSFLPFNSINQVFPGIAITTSSLLFLILSIHIRRHLKSIIAGFIGLLLVLAVECYFERNRVFCLVWDDGWECRNGRQAIRGGKWSNYMIELDPKRHIDFACYVNSPLNIEYEGQYFVLNNFVHSFFKDSNVHRKKDTKSGFELIRHGKLAVDSLLTSNVHKIGIGRYPLSMQSLLINP